MVNERELLSIIREMDGPGTIYNEMQGVYTSEGSPSSIAYNKARSLTDTTLISFLSDLLEKSKKESIKRNIYFILGKIGENTGDKRVVEILLQRIGIETNKYTLDTILERIEEQEVIPDCYPIIKCVSDVRGSVRHSAINALGRCKNSDAEDALIKVIRNSKDEYDLCYAIGSLSMMGATKAIPDILPLFKNEKGEVRRAALCAIDKLGGSAFLPLYMEALGDRSLSVKYYALLAIKDHGDETAIDVVYKRVRTILSKKRKINSDELVAAFEFLNQFKNHDEKIEKLLEWIKSKKWDFLSDTEKEGFNSCFSTNDLSYR
ncbi:HEAT repeat domain-containing protein [Niallia sp. Man26]|uniref:HEAT repeat domain-containing protein n=1 Tax=Niallia sp. Man26 TaxID=2912824 RepID=UPI001EDB3850|nr:HEAT repeat domain-containing protein [Niallia sp. Man26]UPO89990.1 HEAT repeat domain-containing protein [Niallia sp. Man26]